MRLKHLRALQFQKWFGLQDIEVLLILRFVTELSLVLRHLGHLAENFLGIRCLGHIIWKVVTHFISWTFLEAFHSAQVNYSLNHVQTLIKYKQVSFLSFGFEILIVEI